MKPPVSYGKIPVLYNNQEFHTRKPLNFPVKKLRSMKIPTFVP
jgi:hypothetical protein